VSPVPESGGHARSEVVSVEPLPAASPDRLLIAAEAAELLAVPVSWVREATRQGELPHVKLGRYRRYVRADLDAWIAERKVGRA
jgi:excisionase family DNA binding protein